MTARRLVSTAVLAAALSVPAAARADTVIAPLGGPTPVRAWAGTAVLSVLGPAAGQYRLATQRGAAPPAALPGIAPAPQPFDADIGPGPGGAPTIVFARCARPRRCHLSRTTPAGTREIPLPGSAATAGWESAPTVWGRRLVFARHYTRGGDVVYTRPLTAGTQTRSVRLPGAPRGGTVPELELRRGTLAENTHNDRADVGICGEEEMRLVDVARRTSRRVASTICGLSGSSYVGASLTATHLLYVRICPGDAAGCALHNAIAYRYDLRDHRIAQVPRPAVLTGFSATSDTAALEIQAPEQAGGNCTNYLQDASPTCSLVRADALGFSG